MEFIKYYCFPWLQKSFAQDYNLFSTKISPTSIGKVMNVQIGNENTKSHFCVPSPLIFPIWGWSLSLLTYLPRKLEMVLVVSTIDWWVSLLASVKIYVTFIIYKITYAGILCGSINAVYWCAVIIIIYWILFPPTPFLGSKQLICNVSFYLPQDVCKNILDIQILLYHCISS